ncbi:MAG: flavin reductase family protein [Planctomycetes bacterium]|nr:flavin reductase family protein [Planctomycetota bacterium]MBM4086486.1 flavin reductase family protein [Planctomycetota bacterium]
MKTDRKPQRPVYPTPAGLVTSVDKNGKPNIITLGEIFNLSIREPVWVGISIRPATYSHGLIKEQGEFVVNLPTAAMLPKVLGCGSVSGRDGVDKFQRFGLTPLPAKLVKPPLIAECPVNLECRVVGFHNVGDHDLFIGHVLLEHIDQDALDAQGKADMNKLDPLIMLPGGFWRIGERIK